MAPSVSFGNWAGRSESSESDFLTFVDVVVVQTFNSDLLSAIALFLSCFPEPTSNI